MLIDDAEIKMTSAGAVIISVTVGLVARAGLALALYQVVSQRSR